MKAANDSRFDWSKADSELAKEHKVTRERIRQIRKELGLPPSPRSKAPPINTELIDPSTTLTQNAKLLGVSSHTLKRFASKSASPIPMKQRGLAAIHEAAQKASIPLHLPDIALAELTGLKAATFSAQRKQNKLPSPIITGHAWTIIRRKYQPKEALELLKPYANSPAAISGTHFQKLFRKTSPNHE